MERSWSPPVAQAFQRHTGSWKLSPLDLRQAALPVTSPVAGENPSVSIMAVADELPVAPIGVGIDIERAC